MNFATESNNAFAIHMFNKVKQEKETHVYSPLSIFLALSMTSLGATTGESWIDFCKVFFPYFASSSEHTVHEAVSDLMFSLQVSKELVLANRIFHTSGIAPKSEFVQNTNKFYKSGAAALDTSKPVQAAKLVNDWCASKTNNMITHVVSDNFITPDLIMIIVNAVYFKGIWRDQFNAEYTRPRRFAGKEGAVEIPMMHLRDPSMPYYATETYSSLKMPYKGDEFCMIFIKPNESLDKVPFTFELMAQVLSNLTNDTKLTEVAIPKMTLESSFSVAGKLQQMGLKQAFAAGGLSKISSDAYITDVVHVAKIEIDEQGTRASAVTAVMVATESEAVLAPSFVLDQPFYYTLVHSKSNAITFMGQVTNVSSAAPAKTCLVQ